MTTLLLTLDAPLQSWGTSSGYVLRDTGPAPSFSGIIGMVANAEGRDRADDISDLTRLAFGVRTNRAGAVMEDFYTVGTDCGIVEIKNTKDKPVRDQGVAGTKRYLAGAHFTVGLSGEAAALTRIAAALGAPARPLFAGRKSCPVTATGQTQIVEAELEDALRGADYPKAHDPVATFRLPALLTDPMATVVADVPASFASRRFTPRAYRMVTLRPAEETS